MVEPCYPFQSRQLHRLTRLPGCPAMNQFRLVQAVNRLGQRIIIVVALVSYRGLDAGLSKALAVPNRYILRASLWWNKPSSSHQ